MVDTDISHYAAGTATVAANGTTVTGQGTLWASAVRRGDMFGTHVGDGIRIASVESNTALTLAHPWPGDAQTEGTYEIQRSPYELGYQRAVEELIAGISEGNVPLLAALTAAANKLPYFDSSNSMALADFPAWARSLFAETGQLPNARIRDDLPPDKAFRRGNILGTVSQSGGVPTGAIIERGSNANGQYVRFADGTQLCWLTMRASLYVAVGPTGHALDQVSNPWPATFSGTPIRLPHVIASSAPLGAWCYFRDENHPVTNSNTGRIRTALSEDGSGQWADLGVFGIGRWF